MESQFNKLLSDVRAEQDYQKLEKAHTAFVANVSNGCFLSNPILKNSIQEILNGVLRFCNSFSDHQIFNQEWLDEHKLSFQSSSVKFCWAMSTLGHRQNSPFVSKLITRIDYNRYYTEKSKSVEYSGFLSLDTC